MYARLGPRAWISHDLPGLVNTQLLAGYEALGTLDTRLKALTSVSLFP